LSSETFSVTAIAERENVENEVKLKCVE